MTASDLIKSSMRALGVVASGETPTNGELTDGLEALNMLLDSWANRRQIVHARVLDNFTLVAGTGSYTIGTSGTWDVLRPQRIENAYIRDGSTDSPIEVIDKDRYDAIADKTTQGAPRWLFFDPTYALAKCYLYPVPDKAYTLYLDSWKPLTKFTALTDTVTLPPGYERALKYNLAVEIAPEYGKAIPQEIALAAQDSLSALKSFNAVRVESDLGLPVGKGGKYNIYTDE